MFKMKELKKFKDDIIKEVSFMILIALMSGDDKHVIENFNEISKFLKNNTGLELDKDDLDNIFYIIYNEHEDKADIFINLIGKISSLIYEYLSKHDKYKDEVLKWRIINKEV